MCLGGRRMNGLDKDIEKAKQEESQNKNYKKKKKKKGCIIITGQKRKRKKIKEGLFSSVFILYRNKKIKILKLKIKI